MSQLQMMINGPQCLYQFIHAATPLITDGKPYQVELKPYKRKRSLDQNALYWMWLTELSKYLTGKGRKFATKEWCHDAMRHSFLGFEEKEFMNVTTGEVTTSRALRSTTKLNTGGFTFYLEQIEAWALNIGCLLPVPEHSEYMKLKREQEA